MVKVNYASLQTQSSTMSSASQSRVAGFNQLISAFDSFGGSGGELIGTGYDAARAYATSVMSPYYKGCILYSEAVADAANTLADSYAAKCGAENLDEEQLQAEIDSATRGCMSLSASISGLQSKAKPAAGDAARISSLQNHLTAAENQLTEAQEKLANLRAFSAESPSACASADGYQGLVSQAMSGISVSFGGGGFALPEDLSWVSDVEQGWADREIAMENNYLSALEKVKNGESLTEAELTAIERYAAAYPGSVDDSVIDKVRNIRQVDKKYRSVLSNLDAGKELNEDDIGVLKDYAKSYPNRVSDYIKDVLKEESDKKIVETLKNAPRDIFTTTAVEKISSAAEDKIIDVGAKKATEKSAEIFANRYSTVLSNGKIMGKTPGATRAAREAAENSIKGTSKAIGKSVSTGIGLIAGVGIDMLFGDSAEVAWGKEITNTVTTAGAIALIEGGSVVLASVGMMANPISLGLGATVAIGVGIAYANEWARETFPEVKKFEDNVGKAVVSGWNNMVNGVKGLFSW
ncbi:hypothetical protein FFV08_11485 [Streptococcus sanguinis]|uniref:LXG domain-containing protein n=1 Tax=Streptococcus sanguinis TaxID=1305 RepID=A0A7H8V9K8_STRSA|nr:hypothetical protein FFV08_11485 [Streptococcus sanguinis]